MTRINVGVDPRELPGRLLLAEHREIIRVPIHLKRKLAANRKRITIIPRRFTLGRGHVVFFLNKLGYLRRRYEALYRECQRRGYRVSYRGRVFDDVPRTAMGDYLERPRDRRLIEDRIRSKGFELLPPT